MKGSVRKRGEKWSYYFTIGVVDGKRKIKEKGGFRTKKEAQTALREAIADFETQGFVQQKSDYTLYEFIEYWYETVAKTYLKPTTLDLYFFIMQNYLKEEIGTIKLNKITPVILQNFLSNKQQNGLSSGSVQNLKKVLNNSLKLAVKQGYIKTNPLSSVEIRNKSTSNEKRVLSKTEIESILNEVRNTKYYIPYVIALHTGMRLGEILALTWDDVNLENNRIYINKTLIVHNKNQLSFSTPKTQSSNRDILITQELKEILLDWKMKQPMIIQNMGYSIPKDEYVCTDEKGDLLNPRQFSARTSVFVKRTGVSFKFHDFRHTHATMLLESGVNAKIVQERLGHSNISTTLGIYSHVTKFGEEEAISKFQQHLKHLPS
ncbi:site-specific integrase [Turicibacter sanguinis]|uniref:site-specific integrase n=1 Tax=Turicibacter sanguinis TaxID=154288 RepID=UPI0018A998BD|nr:site-specific integrase [Turicibacter sanguinis]MDB8552618.1 site-specific integrase [Turicibacter sanguinis]